jgi:chromosome segregation ATPase
MKVKNFTTKPQTINSYKIIPKITPVDIFTELKDRRQELEAVESVTQQYIERNSILDVTIVLKNIEIEEADTKVDLAFEQLENANLIIKQDKNYLNEILSSIEQQEAALSALKQAIRERAEDADDIQQTLTGLKNTQTEFYALQGDITAQKAALVEMDAELIAKQALVDTFERNYAKKINKAVTITSCTKFK